MKKSIFAMILAAVMLLSCFGCAEEISKADLAGDWTLISVDDQQLSDTGADFTLSEDGSAVLYWNGNTIEADWDVQGSEVVFTNSDGPMMLMQINDGDSIQAEIEGTVYTFGRATESFEISSTEVAENVSASDYIGNWSASRIIAYGSEFNAADFGITMQMIIGDGECTLITDDTDELTYDAVFADGMLNIGSGADLINCYMLTDGNIAFQLEDSEITMTVIMERVI